MTPGWSISLAAHASQVAATANSLAGERLDGTGIARTTIVHAMPGSQEPLAIAEKALIPFELTRFPPADMRCHR